MSQSRLGPPHVGFYVHYHGMGHKHRTEAILNHLQYPGSVITSRLHSMPWRGEKLCGVIGIECDIDGVPSSGCMRSGDVPGLHYAPLWTSSCTRRVAQYTAWLDRVRPSVVVVDVSVEISMLTRLASVPQIVVRQHGDRNDPAHLGAYFAAESLLAPFPESMEDSITPTWVREKTVYLSGFCRSESKTNSKPMSRRIARERLNLDAAQEIVVVMFGSGGNSKPLNELIDAANLMKDHLWIIVGASPTLSMNSLPSNLRFAGWVADPSTYLHAADVVVTAAGHNSVMEAGQARCRFVAIAEPRPFDEQVRKAKVLQRERLAIGLHHWPEKYAWPQLLDSAMRLDPSRWDKIFEEDGAAQAARHIETIADRSFRISHSASNAPQPFEASASCT